MNYNSAVRDISELESRKNDISLFSDLSGKQRKEIEKQINERKEEVNRIAEIVDSEVTKIGGRESLKLFFDQKIRLIRDAILNTMDQIKTRILKYRERLENVELAIMSAFGIVLNKENEVVTKASLEYLRELGKIRRDMPNLFTEINATQQFENEEESKDDYQDERN